MFLSGCFVEAPWNLSQWSVPLVSVTLTLTHPCSATVTSMRREGQDCSQIDLSSGDVSPSISLLGPCQCSSGLATTFTTSTLSTSTCMTRPARQTDVPYPSSRLWKISDSLLSRKETTWFWRQFAIELIPDTLNCLETDIIKKTYSSAITLVLQWRTTTMEKWAAPASSKWRQTEPQRTKEASSPVANNQYTVELFMLWLS